MMKHERRYIMDMKKKQYDDPEKYVTANLYETNGPYSSTFPSKHCADEKVTDVRLNVQLNRIRKFKNVAAKSIWY